MLTSNTEGWANKAAESAWFVVRTRQHRERLASSCLAQRNIANYLPMLVEQSGSSLKTDAQPLFPGYLFVRAALPADFQRIVWCRGVKDFVRVAGAPGALENGIVELIRRQEGPDGMIRWSPRSQDSGRVRINEGPFRGLTAMIDRRMPARRRVLVLLEILQRQTRVELPERWVTRA